MNVLPDNFHQGTIYMANPRDACTAINPPKGSGQSFFLLIDDGGCSYYDKVWFVIVYVTVQIIFHAPETFHQDYQMHVNLYPTECVYARKHVAQVYLAV